MLKPICLVEVEVEARASANTGPSGSFFFSLGPRMFGSDNQVPWANGALSFLIVSGPTLKGTIHHELVPVRSNVNLVEHRSITFW